MTDDRTRDDDWNRTQWRGEGQGDEPAGTPTGEATDERWSKTQWVGEGQGEAGPSDPDQMKEGDSELSGDRHAPGEEHWGRDQADKPAR